MRSYVADHRGGVATTGDFVAAMSAAAGRDLTSWFAQHRIRAQEAGAAKDLDPNLYVPGLSSAGSWPFFVDWMRDNPDASAGTKRVILSDGGGEA